MPLELRFTRARDDVEFDFTGKSTPVKRVEFYIGEFGPFVETFAREQFSDAALNARVEALRATLRNLPK